MARKKGLFAQAVKQAKSSWTMILTYIYILGGLIETQIGFVEQHVAEEWRAPAWIISMLLIGMARMRSIVKDVKNSAAPKDAP